MGRNFSFVLLTLCVFIASSCGPSRRTVGLEQGWEVLGEQSVNFLRDKDVIQVRTNTLFTAIRFSVEDRDVRISDLKIQFANGDKLEPAIDETITAGESSRVIELAREGKVISNIEFKYRTIGNVLKGRAKVLVTGRRYDPYRY